MQVELLEWHFWHGAKL